MADFINTIDVLGDDEAFARIVGRTITEFKDDTVTTVGQYAFYGCTQLAEVDLPNATDIKTNAFEACTSLTSLYFPAVTSIGNRICSGCTSLKSISFPAATYTGYEAFQNVTSITDVNFPNAITVADACLQKTSIAKLDLPKATSIKNAALNNCSKLKALLLRNDAICTLATSNALVGTPIASGTGYIYVPRALLSDTDETKDYRRATNWSTFAAQFRAIEDFSVDGTITGELDETKIAA